MAKDSLIGFKVVVIGGSAGSLETVLSIIQKLPTNPQAVFVIILHRKNDKDSILEDLISYKTNLEVIEVEDKEPIVVNTIYIAPPDYHLLVENEQCFSLDSSEKVHFSRPSIDVSFESIAEVFRERVTAILLSGANADGAHGMAVIKNCGGYTIAQDPATAEVGYMPQQAIDLGVVDSVLHPNLIPQSLIKRLEN